MTLQTPTSSHFDGASPAAPPPAAPSTPSAAGDDTAPSAAPDTPAVATPPAKEPLGPGLDCAPVRHVHIGHAEIACRVVGRGPDLLFIHGWPVHMQTFRAVVPHLSRHYRCHLIDLPAVGESRELGGGPPLTLTRYADDLAAVVDTLRLQRYAIIAHDSGAAVARFLAASAGQRDRVAALVLGNTEIPGYHPPMVAALAVLGKTAVGRALIVRALAGPLRYTRWAFGACFSDPALVHGEFDALFIEPLRRSRDVRRGQMALLEHFDWTPLDNLEAVHRAISAPTRLIWGVEDSYFPVREARAMLEQFGGGADMVELSPGKLFVHEERPRDFAEAARAFLAAHGHAR